MSEQQEKLYKKISLRANNLRDFLIESGIANIDEIRGCSDEEIADLEASYRLNFPYSYRIFLKTFGHGVGRLLNDVYILYQNVLNVTWQTRDFFLEGEEDEFKLPDRAFVFAMRITWEQFYFFQADGVTEDPSVFYYLEGEQEAIDTGNSLWDIFEDEAEYLATILPDIRDKKVKLKKLE